MKKKKWHSPAHKGFTLIEILVVIGIMGILAATVLVAVNPLHQFAQARNAQRVSNVNEILNAIGQKLADNGGIFSSYGCGQMPGTTTAMGNGGNGFDMRPCIVPMYISEMPYDPTDGHNYCNPPSGGAADCNPGEYETGYTVVSDPANRRVTVCAPLSTADGMDKPYCLSR